jgi:hypothetical protein
MSEKKEEVAREIDKKKVFLGLLVLGALSAGLFFLGKGMFPNLADKLKSVTTKRDIQGDVSENPNVKATFDEQKNAMQNKIDDIKNSVTNLKPVDIKNQAPVQKIISDLNDLAKQATASVGFLDVKGNICEEAKKRFCE